MKIVTSYLETIQGIGNYYVAGLLIFFIMFLILVYRVLKRPKKEMDYIKQSAIEDDLVIPDDDESDKNNLTHGQQQ